MKNFLFYINIIYINILLSTSSKQPKRIPLADRLKIKACMILQEKKYGDNEEYLNNFLQSKSYVYPDHPNKIVLLAMAYCYDKMSDELANYINKVNFKKLDVSRKDIYDIYNFIIDIYFCSYLHLNSSLFNRLLIKNNVNLRILFNLN